MRLLMLSLIIISGAALAIPSYSWDLRTDYGHAPAKLAEADITSSIRAQINHVDAGYAVSMVTPNGSGLSSAQMQEIDDIVSVQFAIVRDSVSGELTGRPITIMDSENASSTTNPAEPAGFNGDWIPAVNRIVDYYKNASVSQRAVIEQAYLDMIELFLNHRAFPGWTGGSLSYGNGYTWRNTAWKTLRMSHTLPQEYRDLFGLSLFFCSGGGDLLEELNPYSSTDRYHTSYTTAFNAVAQMSDSAFKWQLLNLVRYQLDKTIVGYPEGGTNGLITIDGGIIHHWGHHIHYASYSFTNMVKPHRIFSEAGINSVLTADSVGRFRRAALAWAWTDTNGTFPVHYSLRPQLPSVSVSGGKSIGNTVSFFRMSAELTAAYTAGDSAQIADDLEMAYPAIVKAGQGSSSLPTAWRSIVLPPMPADDQEAWGFLRGHHSFQVMGAAVHRRDDWMASLRGAHNHRRGGEAYDAMGRPNHHHRQSMRGSLLLITEGQNGRAPNLADSGYYYQGWDHNFYPNVTNRVVDLVDHLYWRKPGYFSGAADLTGGANLFNNGLWFYVPNNGSHRKSAFFFGNRITLVTDQINYSDSGREVVTGLIQQGSESFSNSPLTMNGSSYSGTGQWTLPSGGGHTLTDINGNGYYIHFGAPPLKAKRGVQQWYYGLSEYYTGPGSMPGYVYDDDFVEDVDSGYFNPSEGNYTKVYFEHGTAPTNQSLAYTVLVKPDAGQLDGLAAAMAAPQTQPFSLETSNDCHLLYDKATDAYAAAVFTGAYTINEDGLISVNRPGAYMWQRQAGLFEISCGSSDLIDTSPFVIEIEGSWRIHSQTDTLEPQVAYADGHTIVTMAYRQEAVQRLKLVRVGDLDSSGSTDADDLAALCSQWLDAPLSPSADIAPLPNGDGVVNLLDFELFAEGWGN